MTPYPYRKHYPLEILPGDIICTCNPSGVLRWPINVVQSFYSPDGNSKYSHALIILTPSGVTFEAGIKVKGKWFHRIGMQNLYKDYEGCDILVMRHKLMNENIFKRAIIPIVHEYNNKIYPYLRLFGFIFFPLMKYLKATKFGVCSELALKVWFEARLVAYWRGVSPDMLADRAKTWRNWFVVYEGPVIKSITK